MDRTAHRIVLAVVACVVGIVANNRVGRGDDPRALPVRYVDEPATMWAFDIAAGRAFAGFGIRRPRAESIGALLVFDVDAATGEPPKRFELSLPPVEAVVVDGALVVVGKGLCSGADLTVVDPVRDEPVRRVEMPEFDPPVGLCWTRAAPESVWVFGRQGGIANLWNFLRVEVATGRITARTGRSDWEWVPTNAVLSGDGDWLLSHRKTKEISLFSVDATRGTISTVLDFETESGVARAGPHGRFWAIGNDLFSVRLTDKRRFDGAPMAIHPHRDLVASFVQEKRGGKLRHRVSFQRLSDAGAIRRVELGGEFDAGQPSYEWRRVEDDDHPTFEFDAAGDELFVGWKRSAAVVDLKRAGVDSPAGLRLVVPARSSAAIGFEWRLPIRCADPDARIGGDLVVDLETAPPGAVVVDDEVRWTPTEAARGDQTVVVRARRGESEDRATVVVTAGVPKVELGLDVSSIAVDARGERVVVAGGETVRIGSSGPELPLELVLVDLSRLAVRGRHRVEKGIRAVHVDEHAVLVSQSLYGTEQSLTVLSRDDLSVIGTVPLAEQPSAIAAVSDGRVALSSGQKIAVSSSTALVEAARERRAVYPRLHGRPSRWPTVWVDSFRPEAASAPQPVIGLVDFCQLGYVGAGQVSSPRIERPGRWGREVSRHDIRAAFGSAPPIAWHQDGAGVLLDFAPAAVVVHAKQLRSPSRVRVTQSVHELVDGRALEEVVLYEGSGDSAPESFRRRGVGRRPTVTAAVAGDLVVVTFQRRLWVRRLDRARLEALPAPFEILRDPTIRRVDMAQAELTVATRGATEPRSFTLKHETDRQ